MCDDFENSLITLICGAASLYALENIEATNKGKLKRKVWVRDWVKRRATEGCCSKLLKELRLENPELYRNFARMSDKDFEYLVGDICL